MEKNILTLVYEKSYDVLVADGRDKDIDGLEFGSYRVALKKYSLIKG